ncbi:hypothetical protein IJG27_02600 [Candidatus Saccharibacteria bacterium]|nr:hypothetical protein [Candidatus Saccharibacteria bacterium]
MDDKKVKIESERYNIVAGPNKDTIFDICKYSFDRRTKIFAEFTIVIGYTGVTSIVTDIKITSIQHEDGSGDKFNLVGYCTTGLPSLTNDVAYRPYKFMAFYNSRSREGHIAFIEN